MSLREITVDELPDFKGVVIASDTECKHPNLLAGKLALMRKHGLTITVCDGLSISVMKDGSISSKREEQAHIPHHSFLFWYLKVEKGKIVKRFNEVPLP